MMSLADNKNNDTLNFDLKYRARSLQDLMGNKATINYVNSLLMSGDFPNTTIITGPSGSGKTTLAYIVAKALRCEKSNGQYACGTCKSCRSIDETLYNNGEGKSTLGIHTFDMGLNSDVEYINDLARAINSGSYKGKKVMIIEELQRTKKENQEALLRALEYSSTDTYVIITTTDLYKIQKAIQTRSEILRMNYPNEVELLEFAKEIISEESFKMKMADIKTLIRYQSNNPRLLLKGLQSIKSSGNAGIDYLIKLQEAEDEQYGEYFKNLVGGIPQLIPFFDTLEDPVKFIHGLKYLIKDLIVLKYKGGVTISPVRKELMRQLAHFPDKELYELLDYLMSVGRITAQDAEVLLITLSYKLNELLYYQVKADDPIQIQQVEDSVEDAVKSIELSTAKIQSGSVNINNL